MRGRDVFDRFALPLAVMTQILELLPRPFNVALLGLMRRRRGLIGMGLRYCLLRRVGVSVGQNVSVREDVYLLRPTGLQLGNNVSIHPLCYLDATGGILIGDDVSIAHAVTIMSTSHTFRSLNEPIKDQPAMSAPTTIERDCWVGAQSIILAGVRVGAGSVVAANSVVTRDVPPRSVVAGSPAKVVKSRV